MTFNIKKLAIAATGTMPVRDATGEAQFDEQGNPLSITFHSPGTKQHQAAKHAAEERNNTRVFGRMQGKSEAKQSADDKLQERATFLSAITVSFNNFGNGDLAGHQLFMKTYSDLELGHITDDAEKFNGDRGNFKRSSETSSPSSSATLPG